MKKLVCFVLASMLAVPAAMAQDRYISDKLFTYMHSGPSNQFRIIGSVDAGDKVKQVSTNRDTGYTQIEDAKGRKGWVESRFVTRQESMALRLPKLEKELADVKGKLANARSNADQEKAGLIDSLATRNNQIGELEQGYNDMSKQLSASQEEVRKLRAKLDTQKDDLLLKYFMYGGGVAGLGLLFGLILPSIIPRKKRSHNGWA
ncbi:TIGR04211 family SH3 domain-containing protein [Vibrio europaeus]|uniref:Arylsulfatase n=1 Tax=Vibrio europaeus TaxID=300876 RepID=A0A178JIK8_9VIBR|nr:TIGR04211 family SH3 domain-containing protein [Vibrio europaeus]MDC5704499.1 TIGR04211 family SH3 domain-containing protein [Vibrio europaeus]MDC5709129.1 TIGR04211 family SH3 domain-containing protein [Vibrio europaeus]MDC5717531.1 TIGR04211 family SH3 domain-containing protein [Vibrio europaeus]MDC5718600.1 TIGR04211 family SH3 domain-containing protein [Vibrio europaeus]MDC5727968.1 TIGR04211 family SH3 domain-containing protein [Vibrio europaeus]